MTAKEFLKQFNTEEGNEDKLYYDSYVEKVMRKFTQYHVEQALFHAANKAKISVDLQDFIEDSWEVGDRIDKKSILEAYKKENIQ